MPARRNHFDDDTTHRSGKKRIVVSEAKYLAELEGERRSGREFDSPHLHHMAMACSIGNDMPSPSDGGDLVSTG